MTTNARSVNSRNSIFERNPKITILFVITFSVLILDVVLTNIFSLYPAIKHDEPNILTSQPILGVKHEVYHHDLIKSGVIETKYTRFPDRKIKLHTNSLGFKDKSSRTIPLLPSKKFKKRVVFIGDSFTEGVMLEYEDTFVGIVDKELNNKSIEVLNAGVKTYSPIIYWRKIKYLIEDVGLQFDELIVFPDVLDIFDERYRYRLSERGYVIDQENPYLDQHQKETQYGPAFLGRIKQIIHSNTTFTYQVLDFLHDKIIIKQPKWPWEWWLGMKVSTANAWVFEKEINSDDEYAIHKMMKYMNKLLLLTRHNNIKLTVAVYPHPFQIWYEDLNSNYVKIWEEWSRSNHVKLINFFPDLINYGLTKKGKTVVIKKYYFVNDVHFNKEGNKLIAKKLLEEYFSERHFLKN